MWRGLGRKSLAAALQQLVLSHATTGLLAWCCWIMQTPQAVMTAAACLEVMIGLA